MLFNDISLIKSLNFFRESRQKPTTAFRYFKTYESQLSEIDSEKRFQEIKVMEVREHA